MDPGAPTTAQDPVRLRALPAALGILVVVAVADLIVGTGVVLVPLLVAGPLAMAAGGQQLQTAAAAAVAVALAVALAAHDGVLGQSAGLTAIAAVAAGGALAIVLAGLHERLAGTVRRHDAELEAERAARRRTELLARAGELLESPMDPGTLLQRISALPVPEHADLAIIDLLQPDGTVRGAVTAGTDTELADALAEMRERFPLSLQTDHPVAEALRTGEPRLLKGLSDEQLQGYARSAEHFELVLRASYRSAIVLPLRARGRTWGALSYIRLRDGVPFDEDDLALGLDLARRAAMALDNARLFAELDATEQRLEAIVANLGESVMALEPGGGFLFANAAAARIAGFDSVDDLVAGNLHEVLARWTFLDEHGREVPFEAQPLGAAFAGTQPEPMLLHSVDRRTGRDGWVLSRATPVRDDAGDVAFVVHVTEDVTTVKRQEARERLLSSASKLLGSSLDVAATLDKAAWAAVPELADWSRVDLIDERGDLVQAAVAHRDLDRVELMHEWRRDFPPRREDTRGPWEVLRTGRSILWDRVDPADIQRYAQSDRHAHLMREIDTRSVAVVPLTVGDTVIGTLQLATTSASNRLLGRPELALAEELARRAAIAVENARVHAARTHIATTLQRSLLPPRLPVIPGLAIAARFRAAGGPPTSAATSTTSSRPATAGSCSWAT
ncbi:GAF domain-containing protein [Baekduia soli]|uniref:GAF domain-containing protein n=1 Tax=Baekduia soli TaxID=496014 RepID=A0A5B8TZR2_9ACTN|nr:GAF domain-containing protein [Baekduia soli]QEC46218.1 GAF domain-containing protein [Baekduia soli]